VLAERSLEKLTGQLRVLLWDAFTEDELRHFVAEGVAVVVEHVIALGLVLRGHVAQHFHKNILGHLSLTQRDSFRGLAEGGPAWQVIADTAAKVELFAVDDDSCVPDAIDLAANELPRVLRSHPT